MRKNFDIPSIRAKLSGTSGKQYWRSLEELAETKEFQDLLKHEFAQGADQWLNPVTRRNFLKLMGASLALGGLAACSPTSDEKIVPYIQPPEEIVPGKPLFFATAFQISGVAMGLLAESHMGRPTKVDGNPDHPASLGGSDAIAQASVLNLWDPDRSRNVTQAGLVRSWDAFLASLNAELELQRSSQGAGLRILTETITSPSMIEQMRAILEAFPQAKWVQYEPVNRDNEREGAFLAFGEDVNTVYRFDQADVVLSLDANFMHIGPGNVRYARDFSDRRRVREDSTSMNRLYVVETTPSVTGTTADHRLPLSSAQIEGFARRIAAALGVAVEAPDSVAGVPEEWVTAVVEDLQASAGQSIVIPGPFQSRAVHALAHAINDALGNVGQTVIYTDPLGVSTNQMATLQELSQEMENGTVEVLLILEASPVYNTPIDIHFIDTIRNVPYRVRMGLYDDETSALCEWHVPMHHYLEAWFDARAYDGTVSLTQPLINPLYDSRSPQQFLAAIVGSSTQTDYDTVHDYWSNELGGDNFEAVWRKSLHDGYIEGTALPARTVALQTLDLPPLAAGSGLEITFRPDPGVWDGRFANNGWLQELPRPMTRLTWDNAVLISPSLAEQLNVTTNDVVRVSYRGAALDMPVWIHPGQAEQTISLALGFGRSRIGRVGNGVGFNTYRIQFANAPWSDYGVELSSTGETYRLASTQIHFNMEDRHLARSGSIERFRDDPEFIAHMGDHGIDGSLSLMPGWEYNSYAWGMVVDLNACNGCNACVVACQAENNIPVVGKDMVLVNREMHWLRIDTYFEGELDNPDTIYQPMMCHHCEQAPCELVCPVNATVHDAEGLNVMVYNRCIGTRYCSNNCPYKVRRYNFLDYNDMTTESLKGSRNPDVTVRVRGVMEKCTYCLQRISDARIQAKNANRRIEDGEVVTACQAACPTKAIVFGDTNDPNSEVSRLKAQPHNYEVLEVLGTRPRTSYLGKFKNYHPTLHQEDAHGEEGH